MKKVIVLFLVLLLNCKIVSAESLHISGVSYQINDGSITVSWGSKPSSGYAIIIDSMEVENEVLYVNYSLKYPEKDKYYLTVITYPKATEKIPFDKASYNSVVLRKTKDIVKQNNFNLSWENDIKNGNIKINLKFITKRLYKPLKEDFKISFQKYNGKYNEELKVIKDYDYQWDSKNNQVIFTLPNAVEPNTLKQKANIVIQYNDQTIKKSFIIDPIRTLKSQDDVNPDKEWKIAFNKPIDKDSIDKGIFILDENGKLVDTKIYCDEKNPKIVRVVAPQGNYKSGVKYSLYILTDAISSEENTLRKTVKMDFIVK